MFSVFLGRRRTYLCVADPLGKVLVMFGCSMLVPATLAFFEKTELVSMFFLIGISCIALGAIFWKIGSPFVEHFKIRHASLLVIGIWFLLPLLGALPLLAVTNGSIADAYFEAVSGLTASGSTVLSEIHELSHAVKLWRAIMSWMGGMGLIVLAVAILPNIGVGGRQMMKSEITGPLKNHDLTPQINETAKGLWLIYAALTAVCFISYFIAGMNPFDALVHAFTTLSLGGFANYDNSFAYFDSAAIEIVAIVFMLLAGFNFATHFSMCQGLFRRSYRRKEEAQKRFFRSLIKRFTHPYRNDTEFWPYIMILIIFSALSVTVLLNSTDLDTWQSIRHGIFNTVSIATTTGYSNSDFFAEWPLALSLLILFIANFCSCSGSTGGGIKMIRALIFVSRTKVEQNNMLHPYSLSQVKVGGSTVSDKIVVSVLYFVITYLSTILLISLLLLVAQPELDFLSSFSAAMANVSNTGPGLGEVGPGTNYSILNPTATFICSLAMLLGRLEFLLFLLLFSKGLWR